jgi:AbrB family looped-hinge helix DNA binding protein
MLIRIRPLGQITLPAEARKQLRIKEGDRLEAEVREGALVLRPVTVVDREAGWRAIREAQQGVSYVGPEPRPSPEEEEEQIAAIVREHRDSRV